MRRGRALGVAHITGGVPQGLPPAVCRDREHVTDVFPTDLRNTLRAHALAATRLAAAIGIIRASARSPLRLPARRPIRSSNGDAGIRIEEK